jgi:hypothetical protein
MTVPNAPPAPSSAAGVTVPFPAQQAPGVVPTSGNMPKPQGGQPPAGAPGQEEVKEEQS